MYKIFLEYFLKSSNFKEYDYVYFMKQYLNFQNFNAYTEGYE